MVLLTADGESYLATLIANNGDNLSLWFEELRPWKKANIGHSRLASLRCSGVPLHVWTVEFFELLLKQWETLVYMEDDTKFRNRLDIAQVSILTSHLDNINAISRVKINEEVFLIKVSEETARPVNRRGVVPGLHRILAVLHLMVPVAAVIFLLDSSTEGPSRFWILSKPGVVVPSSPVIPQAALLTVFVDLAAVGWVFGCLLGVIGFCV
ncbi:hypothetical protein Ancab_015969 [Ancistrocladus abbreviatus]